MSKVLYQSCFSTVLVVLVLFGTQVLLAEQSNTPTHFRHPMMKRILDSSNDITCTSTDCQVQQSLADSSETYNVIMEPGSNLTLKLALGDQSQLEIDFTFGIYNNTRGRFIVLYPDSITVDVTSDLDKQIHQDNNSSTNELIIIIKNPFNNEISVGISITAPETDSGDSLPAWVVPVIATVGVLITIVSVSSINVWLRKRRERRQLQWMYSGTYFSRTEQIPEAEAFNVEKDLDKVFPEAKSDKFTSTFPQKTCTICLDDFQGDQMCRQLHCQHIFHTECIKAWLDSQVQKSLKIFCPNCHKEILKVEKKEVKA